MGPPVDARLAASRSAELRGIAAGKAAAYRAHRSGGIADVVVLRRAKGRVQGLTEDYLDVYLSADHAIERRVRVSLTGEVDGKLLAEVA